MHKKGIKNVLLAIKFILTLNKEKENSYRQNSNLAGLFFKFACCSVAL